MSLERWEQSWDLRDDDYIDHHCSICEDHEESMKGASELLKDIMDYAYGKVKFDPQDFHLCLQELSFKLDSKSRYFDEKVRLTELQDSTVSLLTEWVEFNNNYLKHA